MKNSAFTNPFLEWNKLAFSTAEMMMASAEVIGHRTGRMAAAGPNPSARDQREFALMGQEKVEAASQSALAIATQLMRMNMAFGARAFQQMMAGMTQYMALAARGPASLWGRPAALASVTGAVDTISRSGQALAQLSVATAKVARRGLSPVHARATANARRLRKIKIK